MGQGRRLHRTRRYTALAAHAENEGVRLGTINSNTFQDEDYKLGLVTHSDDRIRQKAINHHFECIDVMHQTGSRDLKIWPADGTNYPGQDDIRARHDRLADSLQQIYARLGDDQLLRRNRALSIHSQTMTLTGWPSLTYRSGLAGMLPGPGAASISATRSRWRSAHP